MAGKTTAKLQFDDFVGAVHSDPSNSVQTVLLSGYLGKGTEDGAVRVYPDPGLGYWYDVAEDDIVHAKPIEGGTLGGSHLWVKASAKLTPSVPIPPPADGDADTPKAVGQDAGVFNPMTSAACPPIGPTGWHTCACPPIGPTGWHTCACPIGQTGWHTCACPIGPTGTQGCTHMPGCPNTSTCPPAAAAAARPIDPGFNPTASTLCFICPPLQLDPTAATRCFICPSPTSQFGCAPQNTTATLCTQIGCPPTHLLGCPVTHSCPPTQMLGCPQTHTCPPTHMLGCPATHTCPPTHMLGCPATHTCPLQQAAQFAAAAPAAVPQTIQFACGPHNTTATLCTQVACLPPTHLLGCPPTHTCPPPTLQLGCGPHNTTATLCTQIACPPPTHLLGCPATHTCPPSHLFPCGPQNTTATLCTQICPAPSAVDACPTRLCVTIAGPCLPITMGGCVPGY
jgi:hypothetical protein